MRKTFYNRETAAFHERRINGEPALAICTQQLAIANMSQPPKPTTTHLQFEDLPHDLVEWRANTPANEMQLEIQPVAPQVFNGPQ